MEIFQYDEFFVTEDSVESDLNRIQHLTRYTWNKLTREDLLEKLIRLPNTFLGVVKFKTDIIGFGIFSIIKDSDGRKILFRNGAAIGEKHHQMGAYKFMIDRSLDLHNPDVLVVRTGNRLVYKTIFNIKKNWNINIYPNIYIPKQIPEDILEIASQFIDDAKNKKNNSLILENVYLKPRYKKIVESGDHILDIFFNKIGVTMAILVIVTFKK